MASSGNTLFIGNSNKINNLTVSNRISSISLEAGSAIISSFNSLTANIDFANITTLNVLSANINVMDIKQYELSGFNVNGNFVVSGTLSSNSILYGSSGNSNQWGSAFTAITSLSTNWQNTYISMNALSANWQNTFTTMTANSANWKTLYDNRNVLVNGYFNSNVAEFEQYIYFGSGGAFEKLSGFNGTAWTRWVANLGTGTISASNPADTSQIYISPNEIKKVNYDGATFSTLESLTFGNSNNWNSNYSTFQNTSAFNARIDTSNIFSSSQTIHGTLTANSIQLSASNYILKGSGTNISISDNINPLSGRNTIALGLSAGYNNASDDNIFIGYRSGITNSLGANNIIIGDGANTLTNALSNTIVIGNFATVSASNQIAIGSATTPLSTTSNANSISNYLVINVNGDLKKIALYNL